MNSDTGVDYRSALLAATARLKSDLKDAPAGSGETPYLDALVLLAHAAGVTKERVIASYTDPLPPDIRDAFDRLIARRCSGTPVSYIRGMKEFYGREFSVGPGVLVPRPDTEVLVECALAEIVRTGRSSVHVHDCCTGSGCVAITVALERSCLVTASDLSAEALAYASSNAARHGLMDLPLWQGDLLSPLARELERGAVSNPNIITANPPYIADDEVEALTLRGWPEPRAALAGGHDGLAVVRRLAREATGCLAEGGWLMVEIGFEQGDETAAGLQECGYVDVSLAEDIAGRPRVCRGRWYSP